MKTFIEYRVRPVTRYQVTRFEQSDNGFAGGSGHGEFDNEDTAYAVGYALAAAEHQRLGYPLGDERIMYPEPPAMMGRLSGAVVVAEANRAPGAVAPAA